MRNANALLASLVLLVAACGSQGDGGNQSSGTVVLVAPGAAGSGGANAGGSATGGIAGASGTGGVAGAKGGASGSHGGGAGAKGGGAGASQSGGASGGAQAGASTGGSSGASEGGTGGTSQAGAGGSSGGDVGGGGGGGAIVAMCTTNDCPGEFPQGVPDPSGFIASASSYGDTDPAVDAAVNDVMASLTGCSPGSDCPLDAYPGATVDEQCQAWFAAVTAQLRTMGFCAGQHQVGSTDEIAVSNTCCAGKWYGYHICFYGGPKVVWNPGARRGWWMIDPSYCP